MLGRPPFAAVGLDTPETVADTPKRSTTIGNRNVPRPAHAADRGGEPGADPADLGGEHLARVADDAAFAVKQEAARPMAA